MFGLTLVGLTLVGLTLVGLALAILALVRLTYTSKTNIGRSKTDWTNIGRSKTDWTNTGRTNTGRTNTGRTNTDGLIRCLPSTRLCSAAHITYHNRKLQVNLFVDFLSLYQLMDPYHCLWEGGGTYIRLDGVLEKLSVCQC